MTFITSYYNLWWCWGLKYVTLAEELKKKKPEAKQSSQKQYTDCSSANLFWLLIIHDWKSSESVSCSVVSDSFWPHEL